MRVHFQRDLDRLKRDILTLGAEVEEDLRTVMRAIESRDEDLARHVIRSEDRTNSLEVDIEEECLKILALHQPVAADLRHVIAVLKINQDLERIGDLTVHIAERGLFLCARPPIDIPTRLGEMSEKSQAMLRKVLNAFVSQNDMAAHEVCLEDHDIDEINRTIFEQVKAVVMRQPDQFECLLQILNIARHLERIADHTTNIAEDLIYMIEGRIVRHTDEVSDK
jgi:phosphate transport system protein